MNTDNTYNPIREILEQRIIDACDGNLNRQEEELLIKKLKEFPDLYLDYREMKQLPDLSTAYSAPSDTFRNDLHVKRIHDLIQHEIQSQSVSFDDVIVTWFKKYALAAVLLVVGTSSLVHLTPQLFDSETESLIPELVYSYEDSDAESYILYLEELTDNGD
jgi:hypothetical protein